MSSARLFQCVSSQLLRRGTNTKRRAPMVHTPRPRTPYTCDITKCSSNHQRCSSCTKSVSKRICTVSFGLIGDPSNIRLRHSTSVLNKCNTTASRHLNTLSPITLTPITRRHHSTAAPPLTPIKDALKGHLAPITLTPITRRHYSTAAPPLTPVKDALKGHLVDTPLSVGGRVEGVRRYGKKLLFVDLRDASSHQKLQVAVKGKAPPLQYHSGVVATGQLVRCRPGQDKQQEYELKADHLRVFPVEEPLSYPFEADKPASDQLCRQHLLLRHRLRRCVCHVSTYVHHVCTSSMFTSRRAFVILMLISSRQIHQNIQRCLVLHKTTTPTGGAP